MLTSALGTVLLATSLLAGLPWIRSGSTVPEGQAATTVSPATPASPGKAAAAAGDRVTLLSSGDAEYTALAIPRSYKTAPNAPKHLLVFRGGLCVRDIGLADKSRDGDNAANSGIVEESGTTERAFVANDGSAGVILRTQYVSRVDLSSRGRSGDGDSVTGETTVTFIDPAHPDGLWRVKLEDSRWTNNLLVLSGSRGVILTTFVPRNGPADVRILDGTGHESFRVPESSGQTMRIDISADGAFAAAEIAFPDAAEGDERGVMIFDLAAGTHWTYGWRYGSDAEPLSWSLENRGVLTVKLAAGTRRFDPHGRKL